MGKDNTKANDARTTAPLKTPRFFEQYPHDAFKAWKKAHYDKLSPCPEEDAERCAFMCGIDYAEAHIVENYIITKL